MINVFLLKNEGPYVFSQYTNMSKICKIKDSKDFAKLPNYIKT